jgi:hypothetical protein
MVAPRLRLVAALAAAAASSLAAGASPVAAQPVDPYARRVPPGDSPVDPYGAAAPPGTPSEAAPPLTPTPIAASDPALAEQIAASLVARAQELLEARRFADAKQLAVEALVGTPHGAAADAARQVVRAANRGLGIPDDVPVAPPPATTPPPVDTTPIQDPTLPPPSTTAPRRDGAPSSADAAMVHGAAYGALLGVTIGAFLSSDNEASTAVGGGLALGALGGIFAPRLAARQRWTEAQTRTIGSATLWGGVVGGLFADVATVSGSTSAREVLVGSAIGSTLTGLGGLALADHDALTRGDVALVDTLASVGAAGGLTLGMLMQPAKTEAYSLNAVLGAAGGVVAGLVAAPQTNTTPRRMLRVAGLAAAGAAIPFLLYAVIQDGTTDADERLVGALATGGLIGGTYLGFRLTEGFEAGEDVPDRAHAAPVADAPPAVLGRSSDGRWGLGGLALRPLSRALAPEHGLALDLVSGAF